MKRTLTSETQLEWNSSLVSAVVNSLKEEKSATTILSPTIGAIDVKTKADSTSNRL